HGAIDMIIHRTEMRDTLGRLLAKLGNIDLDEAQMKDPEPTFELVEPESDEFVERSDLPEGDD
ncbi:MAG: acetyl-CoA carboxylase carboxyl transferase subunit beta, partial [Halieaceae bacterium]|nr:acetyl-CoA carboxylase carboxyl transferase subunit beta [Halieaceae bacterium]